MEVIKELPRFYKIATKDERIGHIHICLYMALFQCWNLNGFKNPILVSRNQLMKVAKINGRATYHKCIKQLQVYGYIQYFPSYHPGIGSRIYLLR